MLQIEAEKLNIDRISMMSEEEIKQAQQEILEFLPTSLTSLLTNGKYGNNSLTKNNNIESDVELRKTITGKITTNQPKIPANEPDVAKDGVVLSDERFDLIGRRAFANKKHAEDCFSTSLSTLLSSAPYSNFHSTSSDSFRSIAILLMDAAIDSGLIHIGGEDQPNSGELFQHQYDPDSPGYSLREILEVRRILL